MLAKLDIINTILTMKYQRNVIQMKTGRLKEYDSVYQKNAVKKGLELNFNVALAKNKRPDWCKSRLRLCRRYLPGCPDDQKQKISAF